MLWVLSLSKGFLKVINARYAAFSFNNTHVYLDVLPTWSKEISRFHLKRRSARTPAEDLKKLILHYGEEWYRMIQQRSSRSFASLFLLKSTNDHRIAPDSIKPGRAVRPRFTKRERECMEFLGLKIGELLHKSKVESIRSSYKKLAKIYHPDVGGDTEKFKRLNEAHQRMLLWAENPQFISRKALMDCWSYDSATEKWSPPL